MVAPQSRALEINAECHQSILYVYASPRVLSLPTFCQKSLKFTTLVHGLVTRYGPQLKPFVPALQAAVGRCSNFMVKAVLAALQRLEK